MKTVLEISQVKITVNSGTVSYDFNEISSHTGVTLSAGNVALVDIPLGSDLYTYSVDASFTQEPTAYRVLEIE